MNFDSLREQIVALANPKYIFLFGSYAKGTARATSDIDLCVVAHTENKRSLLTELYYSIDCEVPIDILLYTPEEWARCLEDQLSFAYAIFQEGVCLFG